MFSPRPRSAKREAQHVDLTDVELEILFIDLASKRCAHMVQVHVEKGVETTKCNLDAETQRFVYYNVFIPTE